MAWYHVANCSCPVGCCDCGDEPKKTTRVYLDLKTSRLFLFTSVTAMQNEWFGGGLRPDGKKTPIKNFECLGELGG